MKADSSENKAMWLGTDSGSLETDLARHFHLTLGRDRDPGSHFYLYNAAALTVRDRLVERWRATRQQYHDTGTKRVAYLSLEFLVGRSLCNAVLNLEMDEALQKSLYKHGVTLEDLASEERDAGLGNGGLGRLAACFMDSCATLSLPVTGYGLRYEYGMFHQRILNGYQHESPDHWLDHGNPWEFEAPQDTRCVHFYGRTRCFYDEHGHLHTEWIDTQDVLAVPYDMPIPGYANNTVNTLRLWKAMATEEFSLKEFNSGGYTEAVAAKTEAEQITMVLYPNDVSENGKVLRLRQQYFLTSASLQDVMERWIKRHGPAFNEFSDKNCFQLNDTHPAIAVAELMRLLLDTHHLSWDKAWAITTSCMAYTNHTLLPEALERWPVRFFHDMLPRILEIIYEINQRFLRDVAEKWPGDDHKIRGLSIIDESDDRHIRMAHLAIVGSFSVNGVAQLHTDLLIAGLFKNFYELWPHKFNNKTNGVTPRRWLGFCNKSLSGVISQKLGNSWLHEFSRISELKAWADDAQFQQKWQAARLENKKQLAKLVRQTCNVDFDTHMLFDVQVKRIHEYKRQFLNILHVIHLYTRILNNDTSDMVPRCILIGGKAAPGYHTAKLIIKLINEVARVINSDERAEPWLRVAFLPDYNVTAMETICAAADLSEQISTAGKEASGTGNMKFMMNGALTIGTLDGANIEIREKVGADNFFLFGLNAAEVTALRQDYKPEYFIGADPRFRQVIELVESGLFNPEEPGLYNSLLQSIHSTDDQWMTAADFSSYIDAQQQVSELYKQTDQWTQKSILNTAASGFFSSDRTISAYASEIWQLI
jgi:starch phosphorylase